MNLAGTALRFFFHVTLGRPGFGARMARIPTPDRLPVVLSPLSIPTSSCPMRWMRRSSSTLPGFGCGPELVALLKRAETERDDVVDDGDRVRFGRYVGRYCRGPDTALGQSDDGNPQFRVGGAVLVTVPATDVTKEDLGRMAGWNADLVSRLAFGQVGGRSRPNEKLAFLPFVPDGDTTLALMEDLVVQDDEALQLSGLVWVLLHRKDGFVPLVRRVLPQLRDDALLGVAVFARGDGEVWQDLAAAVAGSPQGEARRAAW